MDSFMVSFLPNDTQITLFVLLLAGKGDQGTIIA
jgi:hypothetical protein